MRTKHGRVPHNARRAFLFKIPCSPLFYAFVLAFAFLAFSLLCFLLLLAPGSSRPSPHRVAASLLFLSPFFTALLKQRLAVLYFKVISSNFISCSKKFLPESAIDVITTSTWFHSSYSVLATVSSLS
ncbi:hypothetical protein LDENG_00171510 [Lucifuga dentata]|nr:hypothetical protein LDENG_00171510 [Lucifuga dentata]